MKLNKKEQIKALRFIVLNKNYGKYPNNWFYIREEYVGKIKNNCEVCNAKSDHNDNCIHTCDGMPSSHFHVHHINSNKSDCRESNLIYLCIYCHGAVHRGRKNAKKMD